MNLLVVMLPLLGAALVAWLRANRSRLIRAVALCTVGITWVACAFLPSIPLTSVPLRSSFTLLDRVLCPSLCGAFFLVLVGRGLAGKGETIWYLLLCAASLFGSVSESRLAVVGASAAVYLCGALLLQLRVQEGREKAAQLLALMGGLAVSAGLLWCLFPNVTLLWLVFCWILLGAFPFHFFLVRLLPGSPFLAASLWPFLVSRYAAAVALHFPPQQWGSWVGAVALVGLLWCCLAAFGSENLRERIGYIAGAQSCVALHAFAAGEGAAGAVLLLGASPALLLWSTASSVLYDRVKHLEVRRLQGVATQLPRLNIALIAGAAGLAFLPGTAGFPALAGLVGRMEMAVSRGLLGASAVALFFLQGSTYVKVAFGEVAEALRKAGDLNPRELAALIPLGLLTFAGWYWGYAELVKLLLG